MQVPPTVRREVAARVVLGISPNTFDSLRKRPDFPQGIWYGPQCLVFDTAQLLAWRDKQRGLTQHDVSPMKPEANSKNYQPKLAEAAQRIQRVATGRAKSAEVSA